MRELFVLAHGAAFHNLHRAVQPALVEQLDHARVAGMGQGGLDGQLGQQGDGMCLGHLQGLAPGAVGSGQDFHPIIVIHVHDAGSGDLAAAAEQLKADIKERAREIDGISNQYLTTVKPMYDKYIRNYVSSADVIVAGGGMNARIVDILAGYVQDALGKRGE